MIELELAKDGKEWNELVKQSPHGTIFHTWEWLKIVEKHTNSKLYPLIGYKGEEPIGIYPIFYKKIKFIKTVFSPMPHTGVTYLGSLILKYSNLRESKKLSYFSEFHKVVDTFIYSRLKCNFSLITTPPDFIDCRPFKWTGYKVDPIFNYRIDLAQGIGNIWTGFKPELRTHIKRAIKRGVKIEIGDVEDLNFIYKSLVERYKEQKRALNVKREYIIEVYKQFEPEYIKIFIAKYNGCLLYTSPSPRDRG